MAVSASRYLLAARAKAQHIYPMVQHSELADAKPQSDANFLHVQSRHQLAACKCTVVI